MHHEGSDNNDDADGTNSTDGAYSADGVDKAEFCGDVRIETSFLAGERVFGPDGGEDIVDAKADKEFVYALRSGHFDVDV